MSGRSEMLMTELAEEIRREERERVARLIEGEGDISARRAAHIARNPADAERLAALVEASDR